jgi:hypothetical protein
MVTPMSNSDAIEAMETMKKLMPTVAVVICVGILAQACHSLLEERDALGNPRF